MLSLQFALLKKQNGHLQMSIFSLKENKLNHGYSKHTKRNSSSTIK
jgi:hypothetical protein